MPVRLCRDQEEHPALQLYEQLGFRIVSDGFDETSC